MEPAYKGRRGLVYLDFINGIKVAVKKKRPESKALNSLKNEAYWLNILNKHRIGPKLISFKDDELVTEFIEGGFLDDLIRKSKDKKIIKDVFNQCYVMDKLKVNKFEMHKPIKHIIVTKNKKPVMIDFERCKFTNNPKNVTQFCQYLLRFGFDINKEKLKDLLKEYKKDYNKKTFDKIINIFQQNTT